MYQHTHTPAPTNTRTVEAAGSQPARAGPTQEALPDTVSAERNFELTPWQQENLDHERERERVREILRQVAAESGLVPGAKEQSGAEPQHGGGEDGGGGGGDRGEVEDGVTLRHDRGEEASEGWGAVTAVGGADSAVGHACRVTDAVKQLEERRVGRAPEVQARSRGSFTFTSPGRGDEGDQVFHLPRELTSPRASSEERRKKRGPSFLSPLRRRDAEEDPLAPGGAGVRHDFRGGGGATGSAAGDASGLGNAVRDIDGGLFKYSANEEHDGYFKGGKLKWKPTTTELCGGRESVVMLRGEPKDDVERGLNEIRKAKAELNARVHGASAAPRPLQRPVRSILKAADAVRAPVALAGGASALSTEHAAPLDSDEISVNL